MKLLRKDQSMKEVREAINLNYIFKFIKQTGKGRTKQKLIQEINLIIRTTIVDNKSCRKRKRSQSLVQCEIEPPFKRSKHELCVNKLVNNTKGQSWLNQKKKCGCFVDEYGNKRKCENTIWCRRQAYHICNVCDKTMICSDPTNSSRKCLDCTRIICGNCCHDGGYVNCEDVTKLSLNNCFETADNAYGGYKDVLKDVNVNIANNLMNVCVMSTKKTSVNRPYNFAESVHIFVHSNMGVCNSLMASCAYSCDCCICDCCLNKYRDSNGIMQVDNMFNDELGLVIYDKMTRDSKLNPMYANREENFKQLQLILNENRIDNNQVDEDLVVADIGCGTGSYTKIICDTFISSKTDKLLCVDISPKCLQFIRDKIINKSSSLQTYDISYIKEVNEFIMFR